MGIASRWMGAGAVVAAGFAALVSASGGEAHAGKPGGGGGSAAPSGEIVYGQYGTGAYASTWEVWATDLAGNARWLGIRQNQVVEDAADPNHRWLRVVGLAGSGSVALRNDQIWFLGLRYDQRRADAAASWVTQSADLLAVREGDVVVDLLSGAAAGLNLWKAGSFPHFTGDGSAVSVRTARLDGTAPGVYTAPVSWGAGAPALGAAFSLRLPWPTVAGSADVSADGNRVVLADGADLVAATRAGDGAWTTRTLVTWRSGIAGRLSPDGAKVLYETGDGIRMVQFDGSGDVLVVANTGEGAAAGNGTYHHNAVWSPDSANLSYYWYRTNDTSTTWAMCWAPAKARAKGTTVSGTGSPVGWVP